MRWIAIRMQQQHRDDVRIQHDNLVRHLARDIRREGLRDPLRLDTLRHRNGHFMRRQRRRIVDGEIVQRGAILSPQVQHVREPLRHAEGHASALALEQHIRRDRGPVHESIDVRSGERAQRLENTLALIRRSAEDFTRLDAALAVDRDQVRVRPAHIYANPEAHRVRTSADLFHSETAGNNGRSMIRDVVTNILDPALSNLSGLFCVRRFRSWDCRSVITACAPESDRDRHVRRKHQQDQREIVLREARNRLCHECDDTRCRDDCRSC